MRENTARQTNESDGGRAAPEAALPLGRNFGYALSGNVLFSACQWALVVALARVGSMEMVGRYALGLALAGPPFMFSSLALRALLATDARRDFRPGSYLGLRLASITTASLALLLVSRSYAGRGRAVILLLGAAKGVESFSDILYGFWQRAERMDLVARSLAVRGTVGLCAAGGVLIVTGRLLPAIGAVSCTWAGVLLLHDLPVTKRFVPLVPSLHRRELAALFVLAAPLGLVAGFNSLNQSLPRLFLERWFGAAALGRFAAVAYFMTLGSLVVGAASRAVSPRFAKLLAAGDIDALRRLIWRLVLAGFGLGMGSLAAAALAGRPLLALVYGRSYGDGYPILLVLAAVMVVVFCGTLFGAALTAARRIRVQVVIHAGKLFVTLVAGLILIPRFQGMGAAFTLLCAVSFSSACYLGVLSRTLRDESNRKAEIAGPAGSIA